MTVVAITGHRPDKIPDMPWVQFALKDVLEELKPEKLIQGMAAGVDLLSAVVAYELRIPFISARPWAGHTPRGADVQLYRWAESEAEEVVNVSSAQDYVGPWLYQQRNEYMVDNATVVVAVWDGTSGGTRNCVKYAQRKNLPIIRIDPMKRTITYPEPPPTEIDENNFLF